MCGHPLTGVTVMTLHATGSRLVSDAAHSQNASLAMGRMRDTEMLIYEPTFPVMSRIYPYRAITCRKMDSSFGGVPGFSPRPQKLFGVRTCAGFGSWVRWNYQHGGNPSARAKGSSQCSSSVLSPSQLFPSFPHSSSLRSRLRIFPLLPPWKQSW